jgi:PKD repeat protein
MIATMLMKKRMFRQLILKVVLLVVLVLPEIASAQSFNFNDYGDVMAGFRKTGVYAGNYELVVDLGSVTNFISLPIGTTTNITQFSPSQLSDAFASGYGNLQWSVFAAFPGSISPWVTPLGSFPKDTMWYTLPASNLTTQTQPPLRRSYNTQQPTKQLVYGVGDAAKVISANDLITTNADNNTLLVREPVVYSASILSAFIGNSLNPAYGDFGSGGSGLGFTVENTTPGSFTTAQRSDFYQVCPYNFADPITHLTNTDSYFLGYFILNHNGTMTFTRAAATVVTNSPPPVAGSIVASVTNGFSPLTVVFNNTASGSITNWVWNFGNGVGLTNLTGNAVTAVYTTNGNYTVTLTVNGPGGSSTVSQANYIVISPTPTLGNTTLSNGKLILSGSNCPAGIPYRILSTTNVTLPLASWTPVTTNAFSSNGTYAYTNSPSSNGQTFFRLVSP